MGQDKEQEPGIAQMAQDLSTFAIDKTDVKSFLADIPVTGNLNLTAIEYELQILKILGVGWAISFFLPATDPDKEPLTREFWETMQQISNNISTIAATTTGKQIHYFDTLKQRLDGYVGIMQENTGTSGNPAEMIGPAFARICHADDDTRAILIGTKLFTQTLGAVKEYLNTIKTGGIKLN